MRTANRSRRSIPARSTFAGFRFPPDVIVLAVRSYLRFGPSYRDLEELLTERGVVVDHVTIYRWVLRFTPLLADAVRPCRHRVGDRWQVDETYMKVAGRWRYVYRASTSSGRSSTSLSPRGATPRQPIASSNGRPGRRRSRPLRSPPIRRRCTRPCWKTCYRRPGTAPTATPTIGVECDHGRLKARLGPMRGLNRTAVPG
jgi:transposase, IS6 family